MKRLSQRLYTAESGSSTSAFRISWIASARRPTVGSTLPRAQWASAWLSFSVTARRGCRSRAAEAPPRRHPAAEAPVGLRVVVVQRHGPAELPLRAGEVPLVPAQHLAHRRERF